MSPIAAPLPGRLPLFRHALAAALWLGIGAASLAAEAPKVPMPHPGQLGGLITTSVSRDELKDPSFVDEGRPVAGTRYIAFGDFHAFYLKPFTLTPPAVAGGHAGLKFRQGELVVRIEGLPPEKSDVWAPELIVRGQQVILLYCAGLSPWGETLGWRSYRLRRAVLPLGEFARQARLGGAVVFKDQGAMLLDNAPLGTTEKDYGVIDPHFHLNEAGRAYMTYTVVRYGIPERRSHEEFVRYRAVDPNNPARALGPDLPLYDGLAGTADDGVAEAQDVLSYRGRTYAFISSRAGDKDQKILVAPIAQDLGRLEPQDLAVFMEPGGAEWRVKAVGSNGSAVIDGTAYVVYQGLNARDGFHLGWTDVDW